MLNHFEHHIEIVIQYLSDGMMQRMDEIKSRHEVQHLLIYMLDGVVIVLNLRMMVQDVQPIKISFLRLQLRQQVRL